MRQRMLPSLQFTKRAPSSASAADAATYFKMSHIVNTHPFHCISVFGTGNQSMK